MFKALRPVALAAAFTTSFAAAALAGTLTVFGDVNMLDGGGLSSGADNMTLLSNMLEGSSSVLIADRGSSDPGTLDMAFDMMAGVSSSETSNELTANTLTGVGLLFLDLGFRNADPFSTAEVDVISDFLSAGGNVGLIAEPRNQRTSINTLLASLGSDLQLNTNVGTTIGQHLADTINNTALTANVNSFSMAYANGVSVGGGTSAIEHRGQTVVAFQEVGGPVIAPVPLPAGLPLAMSGLAFLAFLRRRT